MADNKLDLKNEICPSPMISTMRALKTLQKGEVLSVETTDERTKGAITKLCERAGFTLVEMTEEGEVIHFSIRK
jgi:TusA-related sulfurtransferase